MPGRGPAPKAQRRNKADVPIRGEWQPSVAVGWQHSEAHPKPPAGLRAETIVAWKTWMGAWFAAHWTPDDLPGLRLLAVTYDQVMRGEFQRGPELRMLLDGYGITPKGQQDRRWTPPKAEDKPVAAADPNDPYARLRAVS